MLHRPTSRLFLASLVGLTLPPMAKGDVFLETAYVPTSSVIGYSSLLPTSYVVPTSYASTYLPTSYTSTYLPTSYLSTSAVLDSDAYLYPTSTTIVRRSVFRPRRYVERSYVSSPLLTTSYLQPTAYLAPSAYLSTSSLLPTTYLSGSYLSPTSYVIDNGVVATSASSSYPCETSTTSSPKSSAPRASNGSSGESGNSIMSKPASEGSSLERRPQGSVSSTPGNIEDGPTSAVTPVSPNTVPPPVTVPTARPDTPPAAPLPELDPNKITIPPAGQSGPAAPKPSETAYRSARRPNYDARNILRGRVISAETRRPEEGVTVIVSNLTRTYTDRPAMTDADGEFKVSLPDGDWTVKVKMPSGSIFAVGRDFVTAGNGQVTDVSGRTVAEFLITR